MGSKFLRAFKAKKHILLFVFLLSFVLGAFSSEVYNHFCSEYVLTFKSDVEIKDENLTIELLDEAKSSNAKFEDINTNKLLNEQHIELYKSNDTYRIVSKCRYYSNFFSGKSGKVKSRAEQYFQCIITLLDENATILNDGQLETRKHSNNYIFALITSVSSSMFFLLYLFSRKDNYYEEVIKNTISPLKLSYYKDSLNSFKNVHALTTIGILFACMIVCKFFSIPTGFANLKISFVYLFFVLIAHLFGPIPAIIIGMCSDILGFFLVSSGPFYFGYTIQAGLTGLFYAFCFYKKDIQFIHCFFARFIVNIFLNVILGSFLWGEIMNYDLTVTLQYMVVYELPKNLVFLFPQALILYLFLKTTKPIIHKFNYFLRA